MYILYRIMNFRQAEKLNECPFDSVHRIIPHRMPQHIIKCKKNYPGVEITSCPLNKTHIVKADMLKQHLEVCEDRGIIDRDIFRTDDKDIEPVPPPLYNQCVTTEEDWDKDTTVSSYNPEQNSLYKSFARPPPSGLCKSEKKKWRETDLLRLQRLQEGKPIDDLYPHLRNGSVGSINEEEATICNGLRTVNLNSKKNDSPKKVVKQLPKIRVVANIWSSNEGQVDTGLSHLQKESEKKPMKENIPEEAACKESATLDDSFSPNRSSGDVNRSNEVLGRRWLRLVEN